MKKSFLFFIGVLFLFAPICVKAENKIYFDKNEAPILQDGFYDVKVKVDSDKLFSKVNFDIVAQSDMIKFSKIKINRSFVNSNDNDNDNDNDNSYSLESQTPQKSGTTVVTFRININDSAKPGDKLIVKIADASLTSNQEYNINNNELVLTVFDKNLRSTYLSSLTSDIAPIEFKKDTYDYTVNVKEDVNKFDLVATPEDPYAKVSISSQKLERRKNFISVRVSRDGTVDKLYRVFVIKNVKRDENSKIDNYSKKDTANYNEIKKKWSIVMMALSVMLLMGLIILKIVK